MHERVADPAYRSRDGSPIADRDSRARRPAFRSIEDFGADGGSYGLMPFRFARLPTPSGSILLTTDAGDYCFVTEPELRDLVARRLDPSSEIYRDLHARHFIVGSGRAPHLELIAAQIRTRKAFL